MTKGFSSAIAVTCFALTFHAMANPIASQRQTLSLSGQWLFREDLQHQGMQQGFMKESPDLQGWREVTVPCGFGQIITGLDKYTGSGWFRKEFEVPEEWKGRRVCVNFEAINDSAMLWLNNQKIGEPEQAFLPVKIDVTSMLRRGQKNTLAVWVDNHPPESGIPYAGGWYHDGGILRDVQMEAASMVNLDEITVVAAPGGAATIKLLVGNQLEQNATAKIQVQIAEAASGKVVAHQRVGVNRQYFAAPP